MEHLTHCAILRRFALAFLDLVCSSVQLVIIVAFIYWVLTLGGDFVLNKYFPWTVLFNLSTAQ